MWKESLVYHLLGSHLNNARNSIPWYFEVIWRQKMASVKNEWATKLWGSEILPFNQDF